jgi:hypothetical protein
MVVALRSVPSTRARLEHCRSQQLTSAIAALLGAKPRALKRRSGSDQDISLISLPLRAFSTVDSNWGPKSTPISLARFLAHSPTLRESR